jgi:chromosome segregation protein
LSAILADWLGEVHSAPDLAAALARAAAAGGERLLRDPGGDIVSRQSVTLFAPDSAGMACSNASARSTRWRR